MATEAWCDRRRHDLIMLTLRVLSCGHGDTLLLHLPGGKWVLIDCHLPKPSDRERFYQLTDNLGIRTFEYVVLTHADSDHYRGMTDVLLHFTSAGRSVRYFCDSGASHKHIDKLLLDRGTPKADRAEYARLRTTIVDLQEQKKITRHWLNDGTATVRLSGVPDDCSLVVVAPAVQQLADAQDRALLGKKGLPNVNELSVAIVVQRVAKGSSCRMFLPGDLEGNGMTTALGCWDRHSDNTHRARNFDVIKVPHHGSVNGHDQNLFSRIAQTGESVAVISCGQLFNLPRQSVVGDYLNSGWRVFCTSPRHALPQRSSALQQTLSSRRSMTTQSAVGSDIVVEAEPSKPLQVDPGHLEIRSADLPAYK
jgi:beta-lactamase superfamily II metal-dependent hydrolase